MPAVRPRIAALLLLAVGTSAAAQSVSARPSATRITYPDTRRTVQVDSLHGQSVADPYRWLEDVDSPETRAWVQAQNRVTFGYLEGLPERRMIRDRLTQLWNYPRIGVPSRDGRYWFWTENTGLQNQNVLYVREGRDGPKRVLLDPNTLSSDGTAALSGGGRSDDGRYYAYGIAHRGSDWSTMYVRDVSTGRDLPDSLQWVKFSGASWTKDAKGFFYVRYPAPEGNQYVSVTRGPKIYYHRLGTPQSADVLIHERPDQPEWYLGASVTDDGRYLFVNASRGTESKNRLWYADLGDPMRPNVQATIRPLFERGDAAYTLVDNDGTTFFMTTDRGAPRSRLVSFDLARPEEWRTVVPESRDNLTGADVAGGRLVLFYLADAKSDVRFYTKDGREAGTLPLPGIGSVGGFSGREEDDEVHYSFSSYVSPATVYRYDMRTAQNVVHSAPQVNFDVSKYETRQVFYPSRDGTRVPMFITMRKGTRLNGNNPTMLYAYGGFDISMTPGFSPANLVWLELGGIYAVANLRGGGEYGQAWHEAGMLHHKQNVFDDFIAAGEYLVRERYTSPGRLAIRGGSNGGLLVGAVTNQRPDLFAVAIPQVGVMDMLRFHKFTVGWGWQAEYGYPSDSASHFETLRGYSPLHNIVLGTRYPATLVTTGDHDDRVVPGHSFKYAAALQAAQAGDAPVLIRIETSAGHGAGKPTAKVIEETADIFAFAFRNMNARATMTP